MKKIRIAHLYYDLMNLYGENGNIKALERFIDRQGTKVEIDRLSLEDKKDFKKYDFYYLGSGSEQNEMLVLGDLSKYKDDIREAIEDDKIFLVTGNSMEIFGKKKQLRNGTAVECLGIFDYSSVESETRIVGEVLREFEQLGEKGHHIIGFKNCSSKLMTKPSSSLFDSMDSVRVNNFFGMMFFGPILIRNPHFTDYILQILYDKLELEYVIDESSCEYDAYREYVKNFVDTSKLD